MRDFNIFVTKLFIIQLFSVQNHKKYAKKWGKFPKKYRLYANILTLPWADAQGRLGDAAPAWTGG